MRYDVQDTYGDFDSTAGPSRALFRYCDRNDAVMICEDVSDPEDLLLSVLDELNRLGNRVETLEQGLLGEFNEDD